MTYNPTRGRELSRLRVSAWRARRAHRRLRERREARLKATCWCEQAVVQVPASEVRAGRTGTCGATTCHA